MMTAPLVRAALDRRGQAALWAAGNSMAPSIAPGTRLIIGRKHFNDVNVGDVVAIDCGGSVVVHRVGWRNGEQLATIGDNLQLFDPPVTATNYLGQIIEPIVPPCPDRLAAVETLAASGPRAPVSIEIVLPPGVGVKELPIATALTLRFGHTGPKGFALTVGVSPEGGLPGAALATLLHSAGAVRVLVGWRFGETRDGDRGTLPPLAAAVHFRPHDEPYRSARIDEVLGMVAAFVAESERAVPV